MAPAGARIARLIKRFLMRTRHSARAADGSGRISPRLRIWLNQSGCFRFQREPVARGIALGLLVGLTPTAGFQTVLLLVSCLLIRGNFPAAFAISWISNPLTWPPLYWLFHEIGERLFDPWLRTIVRGTGWLDEALVDIMAVALGSLTLAVPVAIIGYLMALGVSVVWHRRRHRAREGRRTLARQPPDGSPPL
ncbi:MAG: DUF2062 domain-containing protein [Wenzhouxiangella sp.]